MVLEVTPFRPLVLSAAYVEVPLAAGLLLAEGEPAPFTKVRSADLGVSLSQAGIGAVRASAYYTRLADDVVFEPTEGRAESVGPSTRVGGVLHLELTPLPFLRGAASVTYVRATLDDPPPVTAEDPSPPFEKGQRLAYVPPLVLRLDASADHALAEVGGATLSGRAGLGYTYWSQRPRRTASIPERVAARPRARLRWRVSRAHASILTSAAQIRCDGAERGLELGSAGVPAGCRAALVIAGAPRPAAHAGVRL